MREIFFTLLLLCSAAVFANPALENEAMERPVVDCGLFTDFIADEVMTLSYTASFGDACVTIESTLFFDAAGTASEWDAEGNVLTSLQGPNSAHHTNTGAMETDDWLYISSLHAENLARISRADAGI